MGQSIEQRAQNCLKSVGGWEGCQTGQAKITKGYNLPARYVIHTVGHVWNDGEEDEEGLLASCYRNCLMPANADRLKNFILPFDCTQGKIS